MCELRAELICKKTSYVDIGKYGEIFKIFEKNETVKCIIEDDGIRLEYEPNCYTRTYKPSDISMFFKIKE